MATFPAQPVRSSQLGVPASPTAVLHRSLSLWHLCSLDAPTVAVVWAAAIAWAVHGELSAWWCAAIALGVWSVYVADRLMDARAGQCNLQLRHEFHWRWRQVLAPGALIAATASAWLVLSHVSLAGLGRGSTVGVAALAYFSGVHARGRMARWAGRLISREMVVGVVFAAGCALPELSSAGFSQQRSELLGALGVPVVFLAAVAWMNVRSICCWEESRRGVSPVHACVGIGAVGVLLAMGVEGAHPRAALLLVCCIASLLLLGVLDRMRMNAVVRRASADFVLLTPVVCLMLGGRVR